MGGVYESRIAKRCKEYILFLVKIVYECFIYIFGLFCFNEFHSFINDLDDYFKVRGMETYGVETVGYLNEQSVQEYEYIYTVDGVDYSLSSSVEYKNSDNTLNILYDSLDPRIAVEAEKLNEISTFYTDEISDLIFIYFELLFFTVIFGVVWYLLDIVKNNKKLWKQYV